MQSTVRWAPGAGVVVRSGDWTKEMEAEDRRERRRRQRQRVVGCCKSAAAFSFSHIGLAAMVVAYSIMGGFLFQALEAPYEYREKMRILEYKEEKIIQVWGLAQEVDQNHMDRTNFTEKVRAVFTDYQKEVTIAVKDKGWDGTDSTEDTLQWSFAGALLYAVTVITTIGYGHVAPKTTWGRLVTIVYALIGIPLTFLYLSNIGNFLADLFRLFYKKVCCDICCCQKCERQKKRERLRLKRRKELAAQRNSILGAPSDIIYAVQDETSLGPETDRGETEFVDAQEPIGLPGGDRGQEYESGSQLGHENEALATSSESVSTKEASSPSNHSNKVTPSTQSPSSPQSPTTTLNPKSPANTSNSKPASPVHSTKETAILGDNTESEIRETAILDDDVSSYGDIRETAILDDDTDDEKLQNQKNESKVDLSGPKTPSSEVSEGFFLKLDESRETAILDDSDEDNECIVTSNENKAPETEAAHNSTQTPNAKEDKGKRKSRKDQQKEKAKEKAKNKEREKSKSREDSKKSKQQKKDESKERSLSKKDKKKKKDKEEDKIEMQEVENKVVTSELLTTPAVDPAKVAPSPDLTRSKSKKQDKKINRKDTLKKSKKKDSALKRKPGSKRQHSASSDAESDELRHRQFHQSDESFVTAQGDTQSECQDEDVASEEAFSDNVESPSTSTKPPLPRDDSAGDLGYPTAIDIDSPYDLDIMEYTDLADESNPIGFVDDPFDYEDIEEEEKVTVPISICLVIIAGYIFAGSVLFTLWEDWDYLTGSYFCFITLSTIGFGDIVPGTDMKEWASHEKLVLCALWLAFGLSLLAMCFNLMQEEVKEKCKWVGLKLGLLRDEAER